MYKFVATKGHFNCKTKLWQYHAFGSLSYMEFVFYVSDMAFDVDMLTEDQIQVLNQCATQFGMKGTDYVE